MAELTTFDPRRLAIKTLSSIEVEGLGTLMYGKLTMGDWVEARSITDEVDQSYFIVHRMLSKATPELTLEELKLWDADVFTKLFLALTKGSDFRVKRTKSGSG